MKTKTLPLAELIEDFSLYPRGSVDDVHVAHIADALESGSHIPAVIVDEKTKRIVDGVHRSRAWRRVFGQDSSIECECRSYRDDKELFADAMRLNASHGRNLSNYDRTIAIQKAIRLDMRPEDIAAALNMKPEAVTEIRSMRCARIDGTRSVVALKLPVRHLSGTVVTKSQGEAIEKLGGNQQVFYANQLIILIENDLLDTENEALLSRLKLLHALLGKMKL